MPRKRMIDPSIWDDPDVGELSSDEFKLFIGCISMADDEGRLDADPRALRKAIFGYSEDLSVDTVELLRNSLASKLGNVHLYTIDGKDYIALLKWLEHQRLGSWAKPSSIPAPSGQVLNEILSSTEEDLAPNESIESIKQESIEQNTTNGDAVADWLQSIQIDEPVRSELASDPRNDLDYLQALWPSAKGRQGLFVSMVRKRSAPPRASPKVGSEADRYRYVSGEYAECIQS